MRQSSSNNKKWEKVSQFIFLNHTYTQNHRISEKIQRKQLNIDFFKDKIWERVGKDLFCLCFLNFVHAHILIIQIQITLLLISISFFSISSFHSLPPENLKKFVIKNKWVFMFVFYQACKVYTFLPIQQIVASERRVFPTQDDSPMKSVKLKWVKRKNRLGERLFNSYNLLKFTS